MKKSRFISMLLCVCMVMSLFTGFAGSASADDVITYTVQNGDYLYKICKNHGLDYYQCKAAIMALNSFTTEAQLNRLSVGQKIKLPANNALAQTAKTTTTTTVSTSTTIGGTTTTTSSTSTVAGNPVGGATVGYYLVPYVVKSGDTLNNICNALGTSYYNYSNIILGVNGLKNANSIQPGKTVYIPTATPASAGSCYAVVAHSVKSGETLTSICGQYGLSYGNNKKLVDGVNPGINLNKIYAGQSIYIPTPTTAASASASSSSSAASTATPGATTPTTTSYAETGYQISITAVDNGNPYVVVGSRSYATRAEAGTSVVIKTNPNSGYAVKSIKVIRTDNNSNVVLMNNAFTMPESNVQITITYAKGLKITKATSAYGSFDTLVYGNNSTSAFYGDEVVVSPTPYAGYTVKSVQYAKTSDSSLGGTVKADSSGIYRFKMPNYDVTVRVEYEPATYHKLSAVVVGKGTVTFTVGGKTVTEAKKGTTVTATIKPQDSTWFYDDAANTPKLTDTAVTLTKTGESKYTFVVGDNDITLYNITFENIKAYALKVENADKVKSTKGGSYITFTVKDSKTGKIRVRTNWAKKGDVVDIVYWPANGYEAVPDKTGADNDTADFTVLAPTGVLLSTWTSRGNQFVMPDSDVNVRWPVFADNSSVSYKSISFETIGELKEAFATTATSWPSTGSPMRTGKATDGTDIYIVVVPEVNRSVKSVKANGTDITTSEVTSTYGAPAGYQVFKFSISADTKVRIEMKESLNTVKVSAIGDGGVDNSSRIYQKVVLTINGQYVDYYDASGNLTPAEVVAGSKIRIWFNLMDGYQLKQVTKTGGSGDSIIFPDGNKAYWYTVTEADYKSGNPIIFKVITEALTETQYTVQHSTPNPAFGGYTIHVIDKNTGAWTNYKDQDALAHAGDTIQIDVTAKTGYEMDQIIKDNIVISGADIFAHINPGIDYTYTFIMPNANVKTEVTFKAVPTVYNITYSGANVTWKNYPPSAAPGEQVSVKVKPSTTGEIITSGSVSGIPSSTSFIVSSLPDEDGYYTLTFTMPGSDVGPIAVTPRKPNVKGGDPLPMNFGWGEAPKSVPVGEKATFMYNISSSDPAVEVKSVSGLGEIPYVINYDESTGKGTIEFTMPPYDVILVATTGYVEHGIGG